jgi:hypothetical protein
MRKTMFGLLLVAISILFFPAPSPADVLTNDSVVMMIKGGLGEDLILTKIKSSPTNFDLSIPAILELKKQGLSENILKAMVETQGAPPAVPQGPFPPQMAAQKVPAEILILRNGTLEELLYVPATVNASMKRALMRALFFNPTNMVAVYANGTASKFKVSDNQPIFYFIMNPTGHTGLFKLQVHGEKNIRYVELWNKTGSSNWDSEPQYNVPYTAVRDPNGYFKIIPEKPLEPGEYGFYRDNPGAPKLYDFQITPK